jgi:3-dehydroquinate synthase
MILLKKEVDIVKVRLRNEDNEYPIIISMGLIGNIVELIKDIYSGEKIFIISDKNVNKYYGEKVEGILKKAGYKICNFIIPPGEESKNRVYLEKGYELLISNNFQRDNLILALGGGVVGDLGGFLAATYMRGLSLIHVPTSLLAQVDSSVGGKTAINHPAVKNLIGTFYHPGTVIIDPSLLSTLAERELITGMAEVIKYALITDSSLFNYLLINKDNIYNLEAEPITHIIKRSCSIKARIVEEDQKEKGIRALLNFGHTVGHSLEAVSNYKRYTHGEAVAIGMIAASRLSYEIGKLNFRDLEKIEEIIKLYSLPVKFQNGEDIGLIMERLYHDKKIINNRLRWILLEEIGKSFIETNLDESLIKQVLEGLE